LHSNKKVRSLIFNKKVTSLIANRKLRILIRNGSRKAGTTWAKSERNGLKLETNG